jgi:hypothetical protein
VYEYFDKRTDANDRCRFRTDAGPLLTSGSESDRASAVSFGDVAVLKSSSLPGPTRLNSPESIPVRPGSGSLKARLKLRSRPGSVSASLTTGRDGPMNHNVSAS